jgi:hypothetical protein
MQHVESGKARSHYDSIECRFLSQVFSMHSVPRASPAFSKIGAKQMGPDRRISGGINFVTLTVRASRKRETRISLSCDCADFLEVVVGATEVK